MAPSSSIPVPWDGFDVLYTVEDTDKVWGNLSYAKSHVPQGTSYVLGNGKFDFEFLLRSDAKALTVKFVDKQDILIFKVPVYLEPRCGALKMMCVNILPTAPFQIREPRRSSRQPIFLNSLASQTLKSKAHLNLAHHNQLPEWHIHFCFPKYPKYDT